MYLKHLSSLQFLTYVAFFAVVIAAVFRFVPGKPAPARTEPYTDEELGAHDRKLGKYFAAGGGFLALGSLHMVVKNLPWPAEGLARVFERRGLQAQLLVELDVGLHRTGQTTAAGALGVAQELSRLPAVEVTGISCYPGHLRPEAATLPEGLKAVDELLRDTRDAFSAAGLRCDRISGGSTPTRYRTHETIVNELRSGTYALLDRNDGEDDECALWVEVTVISDSVPNQVVVDAGSKTFTSDDHPDGGHGSVMGWPGADFAHINEEHGYIDVLALAERPGVGRHLQIIPNHACGCMNLHDGVLAVRDGVVDHVIRVAGRGLVR